MRDGDVRDRPRDSDAVRNDLVRDGDVRRKKRNGERGEDGVDGLSLRDKVPLEKVRLLPAPFRRHAGLEQVPW